MLEKIKSYLLSVVKQPAIFCSFAFACCVCFYLKNFSSHIFIIAFMSAFLGSAITISIYDTVFNENLSNRVFQHFTVKDIKKIIKECDIEINKNYFGLSDYLTQEDKNKILTVLDNAESIFNKKEA